MKMKKTGIARRPCVVINCRLLRRNLPSKRTIASCKESANCADRTRDDQRVSGVNKAVAYLGNDAHEKSWLQCDDYDRMALKRMEASGADFALMAANTPHPRFDEIVNGIGISVISILDVVADETARIGATEV
jgi:aspartate/glutamate racemase